MPLDITAFIDGTPRDAAPALEQRNPADLDEVVTRLPESGAGFVAEAAAAARAALPALAPIEARADALERVGGALAAEVADLAALITRETGKTITDAAGEVMRASRLFRFFSGEGLRIVGERFDSVRPGVTVEVAYEPVGVVGAITPWNFPIAIPAWKIAPAIAFGNAVVWKPSEHATATAAAIMRIIAGAGLQAGAVNLVPGAGETGAALVEDTAIDAISFTGSETTGRGVRMAAATRGARVQAEMGGVNGLVILADADLDLATETLVNGAFFAAGQRCTATSRVIVDESVADALIERVKARVARLKVGDPADKATEVGPLVSAKQKAGVVAGIEAMRRAGRQAVVAGRADAPACFVDPVLFDRASPGDLVAREEVFGPVAGLIRVAGYDEALAVLNDVRFGLCAGICTTSLKYAEHFKRNARVGMVMINLPTAGVDYHAPFGGMKASSYGAREQGRAAREFFTVTKTVYQRP
ncbi:MAG TPA: aldehyde dehydrogenase family protein [Caulobacteraceae bacterium]|nr:aldehyde dehydrogenase family protein [Caulobacteraceae bacterium]